MCFGFCRVGTRLRYCKQFSFDCPTSGTTAQTVESPLEPKIFLAIPLASGTTAAPTLLVSVSHWWDYGAVEVEEFVLTTTKIRYGVVRIPKQLYLILIWSCRITFL